MDGSHADSGAIIYGRIPMSACGDVETKRQSRPYGLKHSAIIQSEFPGRSSDLSSGIV